MNLDSDLFPILGNPSSVLRGKGQHPAAESGNLAIRRLLALAILIVGAAIPAWIAGVLARAPQTRDIRVEAYRYGFSPARIRANRGDRLRLFMLKGKRPIYTTTLTANQLCSPPDFCWRRYALPRAAFNGLCNGLISAATIPLTALIKKSR